jgi:hypothetical protein
MKGGNQINVICAAIVAAGIGALLYLAITLIGSI